MLHEEALGLLIIRLLDGYHEPPPRLAIFHLVGHAVLLQYAGELIKLGLILESPKSHHDATLYRPPGDGLSRALLPAWRWSFAGNKARAIYI